MGWRKRVDWRDGAVQGVCDPSEKSVGLLELDLNVNETHSAPRVIGTRPRLDLLFPVGIFFCSRLASE